jgi:DNA ligase-1
MLAASQTPDLAKLNYPLLASPKLDGIRCILADGVPFSRNMKRIPNKHIQRELMKLEQHGFDGELMVHGDFNDVQSAVMSVTGEPAFYLNVFDNFDLDMFGFWDRYRKTKDLVNNLKSPYIRMVEHTLINNATELEFFWEQCISGGYEGAMVRSLDGPYKRGRSTLKQGYLIKLKKWSDDEAVVLGFEELERNEDPSTSCKENMVGANTLGALVVQWRGVTFKIGSGFDMAMRHKIWQNKEKYQGKEVTFKYQEVSKYGKPRFPIFKTFREDK